MAILDKSDLFVDQEASQYLEFIMHVKYGVNSVMYNRVNKMNQNM